MSDDPTHGQYAWASEVQRLWTENAALRDGIRALADSWDLAADPGKWKSAADLRSLLADHSGEGNTDE